MLQPLFVSCFLVNLFILIHSWYFTGKNEIALLFACYMYIIEDFNINTLKKIVAVTPLAPLKGQAKVQFTGHPGSLKLKDLHLILVIIFLKV